MSCLDFASSVLSIEVIFDCICDYLTLDDVKEFRQVCRKWRDLSERVFKKRVRIGLDFDNLYIDLNNIKYNDFMPYPAPEDLNVFFSTSQYPFTALRFSDALPWTNSALTEFFSTGGKHITDLALHDVKLKNGEGAANELQDIEVGGVHLMSIFGGIVNLTKLDVDCDIDNGSTRFALTLHDLASIQCIKLKGCIVELTDCRITPKELTYELLTFVQGGKIVESVLLNDFVNFNVMEKLSIRELSLEDSKTTKVKLNLFGSEKVKFVEVNHLRMNSDIVDFNNSTWEIETLQYSGIPLQQMNHMLIRDICINGTEFSPHHFPLSLQKLCLKNEVFFSEDLQWEFALSELKTLDLTGANTINTVFPHLLNCFPNLVELKLRSDTDSTAIAKIDVNLIPSNVQKILFYDLNDDEFNHFEFVGDGVRAIETLFLTMAVDQTFEVCNHLVPKHLIVTADDIELSVEVQQILFTGLSEISNHQGIILGVFQNNKHTNYEKVDFVFPSVNLPGEFYCHINGHVIKWEYGETNQNFLTFTQFQRWLHSFDK